MAKNSRSILAVLLALALASSPLALALPQVDTTTVEGRVFLSDLRTPAAALNVQIIPEGSEDAAATGRTDARGHFELAGVPRGEMLLVLVDDEGRPVGASRIDTKVGPTQPLTLALAPAEAEEGAGGAGKSGVWAWLNTPVGATIGLIVVGAGTAIAIDEWINEDDTVQDDLDPVSPSEPT